MIEAWIKKGAWVVVCDIHRDVFFGRLFEHDPVLRTARVEQCRRVRRYYVANKKHALGDLATHGPEQNDGNRIDSAAVRMEINDVSSVTECSSAARKAFDAVL